MIVILSFCSDVQARHLLRSRLDPPDHSFFLNVDNISVRSVSDRQIPEPATAVLLLGELVAASLSRRRPQTT
jgi:hypothetical protein